MIRWGGDGPEGLSVKWQDNYYSDGNSINLVAGSQEYNLEIYYNNASTKDSKVSINAECVTDNSKYENAVGVTPDSKYLQIYYEEGLSAPDSFDINLQYGTETSIKITINVVSGSEGPSEGEEGEGEGPDDRVPPPTGEDAGGLRVLYNGKWIGGGSIEIPEGCSESLPAYIDGEEFTWNDIIECDSNSSLFTISFSPGCEEMELSLSAKAQSGDVYKGTVLYGSNKKAEFTVIVTASVSLKLGDGTIIKPNGKIRGYASATVQLMIGNTEITSDYTIGQNGINAVYSLSDNENGTLTINTIGKGSNEFSVSYGGQTYSYTWVGTEISGTEQTYSLKLTEQSTTGLPSTTINEKTKNAGETFYLNVNREFGIEVWKSGEDKPLTNYSIKLDDNYLDTEDDPPAGDKKAQPDESYGKLNTGSYIGRYNLTLIIGSGNNIEAEIPFYIQVCKPEEYVLQFYNIEKVNEYWENTGLATFGLFKSYKQTIDAKLVLTDENMRLFDEHFVAGVSDKENWKVQYWDPFADNGSGNYVEVKDNENPFTFAAITDGKNKDDNMVRISYDPSKDKHGPIYSIEYIGKDPYLYTDKNMNDVCCNVLLYTRKMADVFDWKGDKHRHDDHHHYYDAYLENHGGMKEAGLIDEQDGRINNSDCDVRSTSVELKKDMFGTGQGQIVTSEADAKLDVNTDLASVTFDDELLKKIETASKDADVSFDVVRLEDEDKEADTYKNMGLDNYELVFDFGLSAGEEALIPAGGENNGSVSVTLNYEKQNDDKQVKVWYMKDNGDKELVECSYSDNKLCFDTNHFSVFAIEEADETNSGSTSGGGGGAAAAAPEVTTDTAASTTTSKTDVKLTESTNADGTSSSTANVSVSAANQKEILKQAAAKKSENIVLNVSAADTKNADTVEVTLDKSFIESIVKDTNATLTVKTPLGDKTYTQDELKALAAAADGNSVKLTLTRSDEKSEEEMQQQAQGGAAKLAMKARSSKTAKGNIKVVFRPDDETESFISEMKALGYTVKYRFYRSTKKSSGYKSMLTKTSKTYINTSGKAGTRYYYKVQVRVYDNEGKLVAKTALKQCKYATRIFG